MTFLLASLHVFVCLFLIFVVLLQSAQAADLAGAFGGGGSQTALGMRGTATLLQKATTGAAIIFMLTSLSLGLFGRRETSIIEGSRARRRRQVLRPPTPIPPTRRLETPLVRLTSLPAPKHRRAKARPRPRSLARAQRAIRAQALPARGRGAAATSRPSGHPIAGYQGWRAGSTARGSADSGSAPGSPRQRLSRGILID